MKDNIKYKNLSKNIKAEVEKYYNYRKKSDDNLRIEDAMYSWFNENFDEWIQEHYTDINGNKRKHYRLDIEIPVRIIDTIIESSKDEQSALDIAGTIMNISKGGLYFRSKNFIEISSIIKVKIDFSAIDNNLKEVEALAMVLRSDKIKKNEYGIGLMFSSIYDEHKENLDMFLFRNIAHHIHLSGHKIIE
ncbi:MAG: PilZ domain-containing protein [Spirochaetes bacterium]|nr:PilZ domain-containing protein [Spirochaetota bacterium]